MKNCGGDARKLQELVMSIVDHYQVWIILLLLSKCCIFIKLFRESTQNAIPHRLVICPITLPARLYCKTLRLLRRLRICYRKPTSTNVQNHFAGYVVVVYTLTVQRVDMSCGRDCSAEIHTGWKASTINFYVTSPKNSLLYPSILLEN